MSLRCPTVLGSWGDQRCSLGSSGASFTRFQTMRLQKIFPASLANQLISYGSCQFPTLGFVVERFKAIQAFIPETFYKIKGAHTRTHARTHARTHSAAKR